MPLVKFGNLELIRAPYAVQPRLNSGRLVPIEEGGERTPTQRDRDRVIHSGSFRKLKGKTQVFIDGQGDYFRTRLTHSIEVAQIARTLARSLQLDEDLAECCALAHDIGHTPFGHTGEDALEECMKPIGGFDHNEQALRALMVIERPYTEHAGLNLCWDTVEGLLKHNGPLKQSERGPTIREFDSKMHLRLDGYASLEAQMAAVSDDIAYNAHDVDDAHRAGLLDYEQIRALPFYKDILKDIESTMWHESERVRVTYATRQAIGLWIADVLANTRANIERVQPADAAAVRDAGFAMGDFAGTTWDDLKKLKRALMNNVYKHERIAGVRVAAAQIVTELFAAFVADSELLPPQYRHREEHLYRNIGDYIAGMTDLYAINKHLELTGRDLMPEARR
jgi:dGTPase